MLISNAARPMYGLALVKASDGSIKRGTVYVLLQRMEAKGFVTSEEEPETPEHIGLRRRLYTITATGHRAHQAHEAMTAIMAGLPEAVPL